MGIKFKNSRQVYSSAILMAALILLLPFQNCGPKKSVNLGSNTNPSQFSFTNASTAAILPEFQQGEMDKFVMNVRHMGDPGTPQLLGEVANSVTWDVSRYSGFSPPTPISNFQKGYENIGGDVGDNAFQSYGDTVGGIINTWSFPHNTPVVGPRPDSA